jgi:hypothetical protein
MRFRRPQSYEQSSLLTIGDHEDFFDALALMPRDFDGVGSGAEFDAFSAMATD